MQGHENMPMHPECPQRLSVIMKMIAQDFPDVPIEDVYPADEDLILLAHPQSHIDFVMDKTPFDGFDMIDADTGANQYTFDCALLSVGAAVQATRAVVRGDTKQAFALSRPPGHHAEYDRAMGFCFFANAFIAAKASGLKVLIIDFDVHHGNGTQDLVEREVMAGKTDIAYASTHQGDIFPGTGNSDSQNICNCPLISGAGSDDFRKAVTNKVIPFMKEFKPEIVILSAGFDGHETDHIAGLNLQHDDFAWIVDQVKPLCPKIISILEGGYNLQTLPSSVKSHLQALIS